MTLEARDLQLLSHPFPAEAHKFVQGLPYIHEEVVNQRLDQVDPSWSFVVKSIVTRANAGEGGKDVATVTVHASLIVKGVARDGVGMAVVQKTNPVYVKDKNGSQTGEFYTNEANEAEKSATTDALKRCARMFGIGRYLLAIPKQNGKTVVSDIAGLKTWLKKEFGDLPAMPVYHDESPESASLDPDDYIPQSTLVGNDATKPIDANTRKAVEEITLPLYENNKYKQKNSLEGLLKNGMVHGNMKKEEITAVIFCHRATKEHGLLESDIFNMLGKNPVDFVQTAQAFGSAWKKLNEVVKSSKQTA